jgi:CDP-glycerol glycerophosphotransferase (TagB/SpsB family)
VAARIVLSHAEQFDRLKESCPRAAPTAVVAGDLCLDRLDSSRPWRVDYRRALGVHPAQRLVVVTSTWGTGSLLNQDPRLLPRLLAELPHDEYRVASVLHPNVTDEKGAWQLRAWLDDARRAGLLMIPPEEGWRAALVAADCVIGDHGSVSLYAAALDRPVILGAFDAGDIDPHTAMAALGRTAPRLDPGAALVKQIDQTMSDHRPGRYDDLAARAFATEARHRAAGLLRDEVYSLLGLATPSTPVRLDPVPPPVPEPRPWEHGAHPTLLATAAIDTGPAATRISVRRHPSEVAGLSPVPLPDPHLVADDSERDPALRQMAGVLVRRPDSPGLYANHPPDDVLRALSRDAILADIPDPATVVVHHHGHSPVTLSTATPLPDPSALASAVRAWLDAGHPLDALPHHWTLVLGPAAHPVTTARDHPAT